MGGADDPSAASCNITVSDPASGLDSVSLTVLTPGRGCAFAVSSPDSGADGATCRRKTRGGGGGESEAETNEIGGGKQEEKEEKEEGGGGAGFLGTNQLGAEGGGTKGGGDVFTCELTHLEPGTAHLLQVRSQRDGETANVTVHTSKFTTRHRT